MVAVVVMVVVMAVGVMAVIVVMVVMVMVVVVLVVSTCTIAATPPFLQLASMDCSSCDVASSCTLACRSRA